MIVYVESNFVLEWILRQENFGQASDLLELAESKQLDLRIPAFALVEPEWTLRHQDSKRSQLQERIAEEIRQQGRSDHRENLARLLDGVQDGFRAAADEDKQRHVELLTRAATSLQVLDLNMRIVIRAISVQAEFNLKFQDAIVLANVLSDLEGESAAGPKLMITRDKDFAIDEIEAALSRLDCQLVKDFNLALGTIRQVLAKR